MSKPEDIPQDAWDAAISIEESLFRSSLTVANGLEIIARAIMAAKAEAHRDLVDCLDDMTKHYVELAGCGDCGFWDPEQELEVIAARKMVAQHREVNTAHKNSEVQ